MSALPINTQWISAEEYLSAELSSEVRHEYFAGHVWAMAGASLEHNLIAGDIFTELNTHLRGRSCTAFINDMKAHVHRRGEDWFYYPDVMVNCTPSGQQKYFCDTPAVIFEVLSESTERTDRREKRLAYEMLPSLHTYILVAQDKREVTVYRRAADGWDCEILPRDGNHLRLPELEFTLSLDTIYSRVPSQS